jgi:hypothetical protein
MSVYVQHGQVIFGTYFKEFWFPKKKVIGCTKKQHKGIHIASWLTIFTENADI